MSEAENITAPLLDGDPSTTPPPVPSLPSSEQTEVEAEPKEEDQLKDSTKPPKPSSTIFSIWPPTQRTRNAVINRLIETLSTSSVLSKRYGTIPQEEASAAARLIEEEAYSIAGSTTSAEDDGIEILQVYSKEISKRMLETVKARAATGSTAEIAAPQTTDPPVSSTTPSEDISSVEQSNLG